MILKRISILFIDTYKFLFSPLLPPSCRFYPSCSCYARQSLIDHGFFRGSLLTICRLSKCHPFHPGGFDPVPPPDHQVKYYGKS